MKPDRLATITQKASAPITMYEELAKIADAKGLELDIVLDAYFKARQAGFSQKQAVAWAEEHAVSVAADRTQMRRIDALDHTQTSRAGTVQLSFLRPTASLS